MAGENTNVKSESNQPQSNGKEAEPRSRGRKKVKRTRNKPKGSAKGSRVARIYPALTFEEALPLAEAIHAHASGERVARLTLLKNMNLSPTSSATQILITTSAKYGITKGSFVAEYLELTEEGKRATDQSTQPREKAQARFNLSIKHIKPFEVLYTKYQGKKLPAHDVMRDTLKEASLEVSDEKECIDTFVVNSKYLGLLQSIAGSETLVPIQTYLEQLPASELVANGELKPKESRISGAGDAKGASKHKTQWEKICFYVTPIGDEGSEQRKHADLFLSHLIEPALKGFDLEVVRADKIGEAGMITSQILEHLLRSRLVIADLSYHNPNVFYEMAVRHFAKLPIIQIGRKADRLPFDVNQVRTVSIDTTDIFTLVPQLETYRSEIASQARAALDGQAGSNPISVFFPGIEVKVLPPVAVAAK